MLVYNHTAQYFINYKTSKYFTIQHAIVFKLLSMFIQICNGHMIEELNVYTISILNPYYIEGVSRTTDKAIEINLDKGNRTYKMSSTSAMFKVVESGLNTYIEQGQVDPYVYFTSDNTLVRDDANNADKKWEFVPVNKEIPAEINGDSLEDLNNKIDADLPAKLTSYLNDSLALLSNNKKCLARDLEKNILLGKPCDKHDKNQHWGLKLISGSPNNPKHRWIINGHVTYKKLVRNRYIEIPHPNMFSNASYIVARDPGHNVGYSVVQKVYHPRRHHNYESIHINPERMIGIAI